MSKESPITAQLSELLYAYRLLAKAIDKLSPIFQPDGPLAYLGSPGDDIFIDIIPRLIDDHISALELIRSLKNGDRVIIARGLCVPVRRFNITYQDGGAVLSEPTADASKQKCFVLSESDLKRLNGHKL